MTDSNCLALRIWAFACSRNPLNRLLVRQNILQPMRSTFYLRDKDCTDFMASVSVTWDETKVLTAAVGEYLVVAKRKGNNWFIGGITAEKGQEVEVSLDFLEANRSYEMVLFTDGLNADLQALDYNKETKIVSKVQTLKVKMVRNGGLVAVLK